jgi:hypothetical protein
MREWLSSRFRSKSGLVGLVFFLAAAINTILAQLQNVDYIREHWGSIISSFQTGFGNVVFMLVGVVLILWAIFTQKPESQSDDDTSTPESENADSPTGTADDSPQQVDWKALRFGIPTTQDARERLMLLAKANEHSASPDPFIQLLMENERLKTQLRTERDAARAEIDTREEGLNEARQASVRQKSLPSHEEIKRRILQLREELFRFSEERSEEDPRNRPGWRLGNPFSEDLESRKRAQEQKRFDDETWAQYRRQYEGELRDLLDSLEQRGYCNPKERKEAENELVMFWRTPTERIERVAARLDAFGKRLD